MIILSSIKPKIDVGGKLRISFLKKNGNLEITIQDNGQGVVQSQNQKSDTTNHKGVGMSISKKRLKLADDLNNLEIQEIIDKDGNVAGTLVRLVLEI